MAPKKTEIIACPTASAPGVRDLPTVDHLNDDTIAIIFGYFRAVEIMRMRQVCKKWREAAKIAVAAPAPVFFSFGDKVDFYVHSVNNYRALAAMTIALPNLQHLTLDDFYERELFHGEYSLKGITSDRYADGEYPRGDEIASSSINVTTHDVNIISSFSKLLTLTIKCNLYGSYPVFFDFPKLQTLDISWQCRRLVCNLDMLTGLPSLKVLHCSAVIGMTGNVESLRVLRDNIERVSLRKCPKVEGIFMDLADFPLLKSLDLIGTTVAGDFWDIGAKDFIGLEYLTLPETVIGGDGYNLQMRISEVPSFMNEVYQRTLTLRRFHCDWGWLLSEESPDWYSRYDDFHFNRIDPPLRVCFVKAGARCGWRWESKSRTDACEINWLDQEPKRDGFCSNEDYEKYTEEMKSLEKSIDVFRGYYDPPTEDEYIRLCEKVKDENYDDYHNDYDDLLDYCDDYNDFDDYYGYHFAYDYE